MKIPSISLRCAIPLIAAVSFSQAQDGNGVDSDEEVFELSPFEVSTDRQFGYRANSSVSGTRTAAAVRDLPFSLQIVTDELIDDMNVSDLEDALLFTAGVQENRDNVGNYGRFNVRGLIQNYTLRNGFRHYGPNDTSAIAQVEVVKGPAGLLYGQVFPGGVVNAVSKKPLTFPKYEIEFQYGSYGSYRTEFDFGGPLSESNQLYYRLVGAYGEWDSFVEYYERQVQSIVPMFSYSPWDWLTITFEFEYYKSTEDAPTPGMIAINEDDLATAIANPEDPFGVRNGPLDPGVLRSTTMTAINDYLPRNFNVNGPGTFNDFEKYGYSLYLDINPNDWLSFRSVVFYMDYTDSYYLNFTNNTFRTGVDFRSEANFTDRGNTILTNQNDFTLDFTTGPVSHKALIGFEYYSDEFIDYAALENPPEGQSRKYVRLPSPYDFITRDWTLESRFLNPIDDFERSPRLEDLQEPERRGDRETDGYALYFLDQMVMMDEKLRLIGGARYERFTTDDRTAGKKGSESDVTIQGGFMYELIPSLSFFSSYSESFFRNEFPGQFAQADSDQLYPPQEGEGLDFGLKWESISGKFSGTLSFFDLSQSNIPVRIRDEAGNQTERLAGERTAEGIELDMHFAPSSNWQIIFNYSYLKAQDVTTGFDMPNVPKHQGSLWTRYEFLDGPMAGTFIGGGTRYLGDRPAGNSANLFSQGWEFESEGYWLTNLFIGKTFQMGRRDLQIQFNVDNVTDEEFIRGGQTLPSEPRRYLLSLKTSW